jgi:hypothetical protein
MAALGYTEEERPTACDARLTTRLWASRGNINMSYVPNVTAVYLRAFEGVLAAFAEPGPKAPTDIAEMADAFAQAVDTAWGANPVTTFELRAIQSMSHSTWSDRSVLEHAGAYLAGSYQAEAIALVVAVQAGNAEVVEEGINPNDPSGLTPYSLFFALMPGDNAATVAVGAPVAFPQNGPTNGAAVRADNFTFTLPNTGDYEVDCQVSVTEAGQLQLALGGAGLPNTVAGRATGTSQIVISTIIHATAGQVLSVINPAGNATALTITPIAGGTHAVSATLKIKQVG